MDQNRIYIMTDSNSGFTPEEGEKLNIGVIPMPVIIDEQEYLEDISITRDEFFARQESGASIVTSQPSPELLLDAWNKALETYETVLYIPMTSGLSGSCETARLLAADYDGRVLVVDNHRISWTLKESVLDARYLAEEGWTAQAIKDLLEAYGLRASIYIAVDTLEYLKKGGRITPAVAAVGSLLNIKPVLQIQGEKLDAFAKVRGIKAAQKRILQAIDDDIARRFAGKKIIIRAAYTCTVEKAAEWLDIIRAHFPSNRVYADPLSLSIATHTGPGALAAGVIECPEEIPESVTEYWLEENAVASPA